MLVRLMVAVALAAGLAVAQRGGGGGGGGMGGEEGGMGGAGGAGGGGMDGGGMPRAQRQTKAEIFMDRLRLKSDQKEEAIKILSEAAQKARPLAEQINRGRSAIGTALLQKKTDEEMKPLMEAYTKICAQMTALEADAFGKIYASLKPNQQKNAAQSFELLGGVFMPQAAAGGGRGMGRGQGMGGGNREGGSQRGGRN
jgi:hypothetical protein